jgi:hypothetical protein
VTQRGHFYPLCKEASRRCFRVYRVLLQREGGEGGQRRDERAWMAPCRQCFETPYGCWGTVGSLPAASLKGVVPR